MKEALTMSPCYLCLFTIGLVRLFQGIQGHFVCIYFQLPHFCMVGSPEGKALTAFVMLWFIWFCLKISMYNSFCACVINLMCTLKLLLGKLYKTIRVYWYNPPYIMRFSQLVPWKHEFVGRVFSGHQLGKPSDVWWIISTHESSFVFIIHQTWNILYLVYYS